MEDGKFQKELFELETPKKAFPRLSRMLPRPDFEGRFSLTFTLERLIFVSIAVIMLMVIVFALGVEKGKSAARGGIGSLPEKPVVPVKSAAMIVPQKAPQFISTAQIARDVPTPAAAPARQKTAGGGYVIVAVTFSKSAAAQAEAERLRREGFNTFVYYSNPYYQVCISAQPNSAGASGLAELKKVRKFYKDSYFKVK